MTTDKATAQAALHNAKVAQAKKLLARQELLYFTSLFTPDYQPGWVHREVAAHLDAFLEAVKQKKSPRLIINLPPRTGKSQLVSRGFPAFILGHRPSWEVICATYGQELADDLGRYVRSILNDPQFADLFPKTTISKSSNAADRVDTEQRGGYRAVARGAALTGRGAHILIIDDPVKDREEADSEGTQQKTWDWYSSVARTRLAPGGGIIICQTRWNMGDLTGRLLEKQASDPAADQWVVYNYPALALDDEYDPFTGLLRRKKGDALHPERFPKNEIERLRSSIDPRDFSALYQGNPTPDDGIYFRKDGIRWYVPC
jgi:hypothetical protein